LVFLIAVSPSPRKRGEESRVPDAIFLAQ